MATVEERIVSMKFDNAAFQKGVTGTLSSLQALNKGLQMQGAVKGLDGIGNAANNQSKSLRALEASVQGISDRFKALSVVGITTLTNITNRAIEAGTQLTKSLTTGPIVQGFKEYELTLNSVQTILANTGLEGKKGLATVTKSLDELNHYSDQTIYNFGEMAKNIGTFTAAGVKLKTATAAIKGIANLAAVSGASSEKASGAMYQLSQALAAGKVSLEDWNSVVQAGMGGKVFQDALMATARTHGVAIDDMIKKEGSFRLTLQNGWLSSKILTETLNKFTGDMTEKQLKAQGYTKAQIKDILKMGKVAKDAATKVKTMSQLIGTLQEAVGSGWSQTWKLIFGDFNEAKTLFTGVNNVLGKFIGQSADARNKVLGDWKALGGRTVLIEAISGAFKALLSVIKPISQAFRQIFPATTGKQLYDLTVTFRNFTEGLVLGKETAENLRRTFAGVFAIFGIGWEIIKQVAKTLFGLFQTATEGSGSILETTASFGDFLVALHEAIKNGDSLAKFFKGLGAILAIPIKLFRFLGSLLGSVFENFDGSGAAKSVTGLTKKLEPLGRLGQIVASMWGKVVKLFDDVWKAFGPLGDKLSSFFDKLGSSIASIFGDMDYGALLKTINTGLFAGLVLMLKRFVSGGGGGGFSGIADSIKEGFEAITGSLTAMQNTLRAATLLQIAAAVGILAIAMNTLAKIDGPSLARAGWGITVLFTNLLGAMLIFEKFSTFNGFLKMPFVAASMILLGIAVNVLASAVKKLSNLSWEELAKGLTGVTALLAAVIATSRFMANPAGMISTSLGLIALGYGIKVLTSSVTELSGYSWGELAKGLVSVGVLLGSLILFTKFAAANKGGIIQGAGIILLAVGIKILASAMQDLGQLHWEQIAKGLVAMGGALILMGVALALIPPTAVFSAAAILVVASSLGLIGKALNSMGGMNWENIAKGLLTMAGALVLISLALGLIPPYAVLSAAAIFVVAGALVVIAEALNTMGSMDWENIGKAMVALGGSLVLIAAGMIAMLPALPGAAALVVVAGALAILTPILLVLGNMSWGEIIKGLVALAGVFLVLGTAGLVLAGLVPALIGLGVAITLLGVGVLAAGAGVFLFATALTALAAAGGAGALAITAIVSSLAGVIPLVMKQIGLGVVAFAKVISTAGPALLAAMTTVILAIVKAIDKLGPKIVETLLKVMSKMLDSALKYVPKMTDTGLKLIQGMLQGIAKNIGGVVTAATDLIVAFINGIRKNLPRVIQSGFDLIITFLNSLADAIQKNAPVVRAAGVRVAGAIIEGMTAGLISSGAVGKVASAARNVAKSALDAAKHFLGINSPSKEFEKIGIFVNQGFVKGLLGKSKDKVYGAFNDLKGMLKDAMKDSADDVDRLEKKLDKLTKARKRDNLAIAITAMELGRARIEQKRTSAAYKELTKNLDDERNKLGKLANQYEKVTEKLNAAKDALADAKKTRDDYSTNIKDQYSDLPEINEETNLGDYIENLKKEVRDTQEFAYTIQKLRDMGLNDKMYDELLQQGTQALPFMRQLLAAGKYGVDQINRLDGQIVTLATNLGKKASVELYQAGVDSAQALVNGLQAQQDSIVATMEKIAQAMVDAINRILAGGIKKPKITYEADDQLTDGGKKAKPVPIKPIPQLPAKKVSTTPSYSLAAQTSTALKKATTAGASTAAAAAKASSSTVYNQYNSSPKALSAAEIYRQTKNQLSTVKGA